MVQFNRISDEIFLAHEALGIYVAIAGGSETLKRAGHSHVFGVIQRQALGAFILSLCKLFENASEKYPNYSIRTALVCLHTFHKDMSVPDQSAEKLDEYIRGVIDPTFSIYDPCKAATAADLIFTYFEEQCPRTPARTGKKFDAILDALKVLRDKRVAHHEDRSLGGLAETDFQSAIDLLCFAQTFVNIVRYGFFGFSIESTAEPASFDPDSSESGRRMKKLIQDLEQCSKIGQK